MPNSLLRRKYDATFALWIMFLLGKHAMFGHDPPIYLRSMTATCFPSPAKVHAAMVEPVPPPRITRSNSSGCVFLTLQRHLSALAKFAHVESRFCGRKRRGKAAFDTPINPCVRSACF